MFCKRLFSVLNTTFCLAFWLLLSAATYASPDSTQTAKPADRATRAQAPVTRAEALRVLAAHPVVYGLARQLLHGADGLVLTRVAPARLPANRIPAYLLGRGQDALMDAAVQSQAVLTLRSIWPDDQLYPLARRANIRIVEIDVANPVEGDLPGITLLGGKAGAASDSSLLNSPPWQDSANLARMAALMVNALSRLAPEAAPRLQANLTQINQRLQQAVSQTSRALAEAEQLSVLLLSPRMHVLANALQLEPVSWQIPENDAELPAALAQALAQGKPRVALTHTAPDEAAAKLIEESGAKLVILSENADDPVTALIDAMQAIREAMHTPRQPNS